MEYLYVCRFSNGHIKVGRSIDPKSRIAQHVDRVSCVGIELDSHKVFACKDKSVLREAALIEKCASIAEFQTKNEWFSGIEFEYVCELASSLATTDEFVGRNPHAFKTYFFFLSKEDRLHFAKTVGTSVGHLNNFCYGSTTLHPIICVAIERATNKSVMRWDLLPDDWHRIWPELIDAVGAPEIPSDHAEQAA